MLPHTQSRNAGLTREMGHMIVSPMKQTNIRELKHSTSRVLSIVESGQSVEVLRRKRPIAVLSPPDRKKRVEQPDFAARLKEIYGDKALEITGTELTAEARGER